MPDTTYPPIDWKAFRFALDQLNRSVASLTDALEALYNTTDQPDAQVLTLEFGSTTDTLHTTLETLRDDANENLTLHNRAKPACPSRDEFPNQRKPWTFDEEQAIRSALLLGFGQAWIAQRLGRTPKSIQEHIREMRKAGEL
jgi:DNA-binding NarL/FixJ family response regulator